MHYFNSGKPLPFDFTKKSWQRFVLERQKHLFTNFFFQQKVKISSKKSEKFIFVGLIKFGCELQPRADPFETKNAPNLGKMLPSHKL